MPRPTQHRNTRQRQVVLEELQRLVSHPTAVELYDRVRRRLPKISLGTVYRNLDLLSRGGTIQKLDLSGSEARFDGNPCHHAHLRCVRCGRVDDVAGLPDEPITAQVPPRASGYQILGYRLEFVGVCPNCADTANTSEAASPPHGQTERS